MNIQNLRIGNYVLYDGNIAKVTFLRSDGAIGVDVNGTYRENATLIDPIPLTEEMLPKLGFECEGATKNWWEFGNIGGCFNKGWYEPCFYEWSSIKCVHQLQNFIHIVMGIELTLDNDE